MIKVGCCGFPTSMKRYFENYSLVELNTTFYQYPRLETVEGWREKAPQNFEFTVKAHQDISHKSKMRLDETSQKAFETMKQICKTLNAKILLIQTPGSFRPDKLNEAKKFFANVNREDLTLVWENRGPEWEKPEVVEKLKQVLSSLNVVHVTDPLRVLPAYTSQIAYFRLHGLGKELYYYQYTDEELRRLGEIARKFEAEDKTVYVFFNNLSMYEDGLRFMQYLSSGKFPKITGAVGLESVKSIIAKTRYPAPKSMLVKKVGWRLVEIEEGKQVRLADLLAELPSKTYKSADEILKELKAAKKLN
ncbi:MAG: DUF72 domain-containing protein [Candidatus Bathyarchaeota archaeon]|nr:DUF72 domain-containing protein [Candidatus Bathyarchaeota archaeon A05DMB-3]MDH7606188.1 DUF72 domain-containing protein [Candidatus Bathyarchaeota archaeon]